jgi:hypothetical protein
MADTDSPLWKKIAWFGGLWLAGVLTVGAVGMVIKVWLK